jgi:hypothetical protein
MDKAHVAISSPGVLTITAQPVKGQPPATHGGKEIAINYLAGAVGAKQKFTVPKGGGLVFSAEFQATTARGVSCVIVHLRSVHATSLPLPSSPKHPH